jgi:hypothetical protein
VTFGEIARLIIAQTGSASSLSYRALPQDDPKRRKPVIKRASDLLGWRSRMPLEQGLRATIGYFSMKVFTPRNLRSCHRCCVWPVRCRGSPRRPGRRFRLPDTTRSAAAVGRGRNCHLSFKRTDT